jgi:hypothetical protein
MEVLVIVEMPGRLHQQSIVRGAHVDFAAVNSGPFDALAD